MFNLDDCIAFMICRSGKILEDELEKRLAPHKTTRAQWIAMYYIYKSRGLTQRELAEKMSVRQPTVVRLLQALETKGHLKRFGIDGDKRVKRLELTEKGMKAYFEILPAVESFKRDTTAHISREDTAVFKNTLFAMIKNSAGNH